MKRRVAIVFGASCAWMAAAQMPKLDDLMKGVGKLPKAPATGWRRARPTRRPTRRGSRKRSPSAPRGPCRACREDGYFGNAAVKILMPSSIQKVADVARMAGYQKQVDEFILSMNRAAEAAAPLASRYFGDAIRDMTLEDVRGILTGGNTAATDFFRRKTHDKLYAAFKPIVSQKVGEVGATRAYKNMMGRYESVPLVGKQSLDLDDYVTNKSLDGLFHMVGEEEKKIRTDPIARTTDLLKAVFGK